MKRTKDEIITSIIAYFRDNEDLFDECIIALDEYNGYLGDDRYYEMDFLNEFYHEAEPCEILCRAFYGYDANNYITDAYGHEEYAPFNPNRAYFRFNGYGNLVSTDWIDYTDHNDSYAVIEMLNSREYIDAILSDDTLNELFNELESVTEEA